MDLKVTLGKWNTSDWRQNGQPQPWEVMPMPILMPVAPRYVEIQGDATDRHRDQIQSQTVRTPCRTGNANRRRSATPDFRGSAVCRSRPGCCCSRWLPCWWWWDRSRVPERSDVRPTIDGQIPFDGNRAYDMLKAICDLGPRPSGSDGMRRQQELLTAHFESLGGHVRLQTFPARHPLTGKPARAGESDRGMASRASRENPVVRSLRHSALRRPRPGPEGGKSPLLGANDGASGVAVLAELGRHMSDAEGPRWESISSCSTRRSSCLRSRAIRIFWVRSISRENTPAANANPPIVPPCCWIWSVTLICGSCRNVMVSPGGTRVRWYSISSASHDGWVFGSSWRGRATSYGTTTCAVA